jgi:RNA polymerase sigma factor (sigma-70 family)
MSPRSSTPRTRPSLLVRVRDAADDAAWKVFVDTYTPLVYGYCRRSGLQDADAADVAQEVLAQVSRSIRNFEYRPERGKFRAWLGTATRNAVSRFWKKRDRPDRAAGGSDPAAALAAAQAPAENWDGQFNGHLCRSALARIRGEFDDETWHVFERVWLDDHKPGDVAVEMGRKPQWVYKSKFRVLQRFKEEVAYLVHDLAVLGR